MPRLLAPRKNNSLSRTSSSSLRVSKASLGSVGSSSSRQTSFGKNCEGSQFSLSRRSSLQKRKSDMSSTSSLRRQKSSRQNSLLSYMLPEETSNKNDVWDLTKTQVPPKQNAFWNIVNQGSASQGPPSLASSDNSVFTDYSSQSSMQPSSLQSPATDARSDTSDRIALHKLMLKNSTNTESGSPRKYSLGRAALQHPAILHPTNNLQRSRWNSFHVSAQIKEEDGWGHFVEVTEAERQSPRRSSLQPVARRYPASFSQLSPAKMQ
mmetsp:Transcript_28953/g.61468  ORF Transcript_28953/g.61468 Transcript_28953/m.61468 type:complete len:265 (+) Transcript_28953:227-1021(+)